MNNMNTINYKTLPKRQIQAANKPKAKKAN